MRELCRRGLLAKDPALRLRNESFALFARHAEPPAVRERWRRSARDSRWSLVRGSLGIVVIAGLVFLLATQRQGLDQTVRLVTSLGVLILTVLRLFSSLRGQPAP